MNPELHTEREWLETNGIGGFASTTEGDCPLRKYHGLFLSPLKGFEGRFMLFSDGLLTLEEEEGFTLGSSYYPGVIHPGGYIYLESFTTDPFPAWIYDNGNYRIKKEVFMVRGEPSVYVVWTLLESRKTPDRDPKISLKLLFSFRESHSLAGENSTINQNTVNINRGFLIKPYKDLPSLGIQFSSHMHCSGNLYWDKNVQYLWERRRGFDFEEDRFVPVNVTGEIKKDIPLIMRVSLDPLETGVGSALSGTYHRELSERTALGKTLRTSWDRLKYGGRHFLVNNQAGQLSIVAGYPWFGEWGRDTMIALPGLLFGDNRTEGARVLCDYAGHIKKGLIPNTLGEMQGFTSYNSLDASLLYIRAVDLLINEGFGRDIQEKNILENQLFPALKKIVNAFLEGIVPYVMLTEEGFIYSGSEETQLTWMDAMVDNVPVTPRHGLAVDLNALWYEALNLYRQLCELYEKPFPVKGKVILKNFRENFKKIFYLQNRGFLTDTVFQDRADEKLRPNMLFATAVNLLDRDAGLKVVETAKRELLTPFGMRTLSPHDPQFISRYEGTGKERDRAYHQGTVWPWPLGIMVESSLNYNRDIKKEIVFWKGYLDNLLDKHLDREGIDSISEVFDAVDPREGKGCFAQAWSVGEILRAGRMLNEQERKI